MAVSDFLFVSYRMKTCAMKQIEWHLKIWREFRNVFLESKLLCGAM